MRLLYGYNDKECAIKCELEEIEFTENGAIYTARCDGGEITAPCSMFAHLFTVIIKDEDGKSGDITDYFRTPEEAVRAAKKTLARGQHILGVVFA